MVMGRENKRKKAQCVMRDVSMALSHSLEGQAFRSVMSFEAEWTQIVHFRLCETPRGRMEDLGKSKCLPHTRPRQSPKSGYLSRVSLILLVSPSLRSGV